MNQVKRKKEILDYKVGDKVIITGGINTGMVGTIRAISGTSYAICFENKEFGGHDCNGACPSSGTFEPAHALDYITEESINKTVKKREYFENAHEQYIINRVREGIIEKCIKHIRSGKMAGSFSEGCRCKKCDAYANKVISYLKR